MIEILVVVVIISILAGVLGSVFMTSAARAKNEAQANQIKKILHACEQFKQDFGDYPTVDVDTAGGAAGGNTYSPSSNWIIDNSLAYRLCQGLVDSTGATVPAPALPGGITTAQTRARTRWAGTYLEETDIPSSMIVAAEIKDLWGASLAYCYAPEQFFTDKAGGALAAGATYMNVGDNYTNTSNMPLNWVTSHTLTSGSFYSSGVPSASTVGYVSYTRNGKQFFARSFGGTSSNGGFMGPVSYALKNNWVDTDMLMPEIWSKGEDSGGSDSAGYVKLQYKSGSDYFDVTVSGEKPDADNVGGNINLMKIQK